MQPNDLTWSPMKTAAFLAAVFAVVLGALLPSAVAASPATGVPIMMCSGDTLRMVFEDDGSSEPEKPSAMDSLNCSACVLSALTTLPPPPIVTHPSPPPRIVAVMRDVVRASPPPVLPVADLRPPATAPPHA